MEHYQKCFGISKATPQTPRKVTHRGFSPGAENNETSIKESVSHKVGNFENNIFHVLVLCPEGT